MSFSSIYELLNESGAQFRIFDMGRRISKLSTDQFNKLEQGSIPYPTPYLHHAWLALLLWNPKNKEQNVVWFLKFPLDEQGYLVQAVRDDFLGRLMQNITQMLNKETIDEEKDALKDNPFSFTPDQEKMAMFHAIASTTIGRDPSGFYREASAYFSGELGWNNWQGLGYQGIADVVARLDTQSSHALALSIEHLPNEVLSALGGCLEHILPDHTLASALQQRLSDSLDNDNQEPVVIAALLRALSQAHDEALKQQAILTTLNSQYAYSAEVLTAIATRCFLTLQYPDILKVFLEKLAESEAGQAGFSRILADLMFMPALRALILREFRQPQRSEALSAAIGHMFGNQFTTH
ncbi:DUF3549 family protein [Neptunomonas sp.]|uniref:DUF3549 family protein n=1 Tax=Neptunomonas TaxID=75687 RepID=UPI0035163A92